MGFIPHPAAVHDYIDRFRQHAFVLGGLPTSVYRETIENALRRFQSCAGNVIVYWPKLPRTHPDQKHRGWCHVLCTTRELRDILKGALNGHRIRPLSPPCSTKRAKHAIHEFERITRITAFPLDMVSLGAQSATAENVPAPLPAAAAVTTTATTTVTPDTPVATAAAAKPTDNAANEDVPDVAPYPSRAEFQRVHDKLRRINLDDTKVPTLEVWQQAVEAMKEAEKLFEAALAHRASSRRPPIPR